jgi:hypothetical protein
MTGREVEFGFYLWEGKIHRDDIAIARALSPTGCYGLVFEKVGSEKGWLVIRYGDAQVRVDPKFWKPVLGDSFRVGDRVEVITRDGKNTPRIGTIRAMIWHHKHNRIDYYLQEGTRKLSKRYCAEDLRHVEPNVT